MKRATIGDSVNCTELNAFLIVPDNLRVNVHCKYWERDFHFV